MARQRARLSEALDTAGAPPSRRASGPVGPEAETPARWVAPSRRGKKPITAHFEPAVVRQLKQLGLDQDRSIQNMLGEALNDFFAKHGKPEIAQ